MSGVWLCRVTVGVVADALRDVAFVLKRSCMALESPDEGRIEVGVGGEVVKFESEVAFRRAVSSWCIEGHVDSFCFTVWFGGYPMYVGVDRVPGNEWALTFSERGMERSVCDSVASGMVKFCFDKVSTEGVRGVFYFGSGEFDDWSFGSTVERLVDVCSVALVAGRTRGRVGEVVAQGSGVISVVGLWDGGESHVVSLWDEALVEMGVLRPVVGS